MAKIFHGSNELARMIQCKAKKTDRKGVRGESTPG